MVDFLESSISITKQAELLSLNRSGLYYKPRSPSENELILKHEIDRIYTEDPYFGSRTITTVLNREGYQTSRSKVKRYMRQMGLMAIHPGPKLSTRNPEHKVYPYLLRNVDAAYPNHIWGTDITYIRMRHGWLYLVAYMDWFSRFVVSWELSDSLDVSFVLSAMSDALEIGVPFITNSDQGSQYTSRDYTDLLLDNGIRISMDGRGSAMDNIFTERLWRSVKYQEVYINDYESPKQARQGLAKYFDKYNTYRPHQSLKNMTPIEVYYGNFEPEYFN